MLEAGVIDGPEPGRLSRIGVCGLGNVGSAFVMELARHGAPITVELASREPGAVSAAVLDAASAFPDSAVRFVPVDELRGVHDAVFVCAGLQPGRDRSGERLLAENVRIAHHEIAAVETTPDLALVLIATPIDRLVDAMAARLPDLEPHQLIGFGGELDKARLRHQLRVHGVNVPAAEVVGEHGPRAIPVYQGEARYDEVSAAVRGTLSKVKGGSAPARNLASGVQLVRLLRALAGEPDVQTVSLLHEGHGMSLTWPHRFNGGWPAGRVDLGGLAPRAAAAFEELLARRRVESETQPSA